jgi:hypothetical protein
MKCWKIEESHAPYQKESVARNACQIGRQTYNVEYDTTICRCKVISNFPVPLLKQYRYLLKVLSKELKIEVKKTSKLDIFRQSIHPRMKINQSEIRKSSIPLRQFN